MSVVLDKPETLAEVALFEKHLAKAVDQGMCYPCAVETAYGMIHGLSLIPDLKLCKLCEGKLNPAPVLNRRTGKHTPGKPKGVCAVCGKDCGPRKQYCSQAHKSFAARTAQKAASGASSTPL